MAKNKREENPSKPDFPHREEKILSFWEKNGIFEKSLKKNKDKNFVFYEGPPTANGKPGIHHVLARAFKDIIPRYKTMQGYQVDRKAGWDTHGLPVELGIEKALGFSGKSDIEKFGIDKFNEKCKESVWQYKEDWEKLTERIGFWLDMKHPYVTYENDYIETLWWIIKQIWDQGLLYQDYKVVPYCSRCGTSLSSHELALGYEENTEDPSIFIKFRLRTKDYGLRQKGKAVDGSQSSVDNVYFLVWTTTPWTLPANVALAVGENVDYVKVENKKQTFILAEACLKVLKGRYKIVKKIKGKDLIGKEYEPLFNFVDYQEKAYVVLPADFVSTEEGTGIVHIATMYGADDFELGQKYGLPKHHLVDLEGKFTPEVKSLAGLFVKDADPRIISYLKENKLLYRAETIRHTYPFCWRCESPLLYYAKTSWFIRMTAVKEKLIKNNKEINWVPAYIKEGRFGEWLKELKDWAFSRERYWGTPLPIWECTTHSCGEKVCIGSIEELRARSIEHGSASWRTKAHGPKLDLHRPFVDKITFKCEKCDGEMKRIKEVADVWFDSGSMPFAQWGYPPKKGSEKELKRHYPADYIAEAIDQTRGWFYTLLAVATLLGKNAPYRNVICLGLILDKNGQKMSKSRGNVIDPWKIVSAYGADALRWYFYTVNQPGDFKNFDEKGIEEVVKKQLLILWNVFLFFKTFVSNQSINKHTVSTNILDHWIIARLHLLIQEVTKDLNEYKIMEACRKLGEFIQDLSTWYLRRSRERFKQEKNSPDRLAALTTLYEVLMTVIKLLAPFLPFLSETLYQEMKSITKKSRRTWEKSVHLEDWPREEKTLVDHQLIKEIAVIRQIAELAHSARAESKIKVRQPLSQLVVAEPEFKDMYSNLLAEELNVKEVVKSNLLPMGVEWVVKTEGKIKIALNTMLTDQLKEEGVSREIIRQINHLRKQANLTIKNKIIVYYHSDDPYLEKFLEFFKELVLKETIARSIKPAKEIKTKYKKDISADGKKLIIGIEKI